jgi:1,4-alpha-glucan branching enzyme
MPQPLGNLCIVLHAHLPYVLHHGVSPHGEAWLFEAAAETYLPLLDLIGEVALHKCRPALTVGLTPVLLEQLVHPRFKEGFAAYLSERQTRAGHDRREFEANGLKQLASLAQRWESWYGRQSAHFERIARNIPHEFAARAREGHIQILTGPATHPYLPLLLHDQTIRAQLTVGVATSRRILGDSVSAGAWLPECAYRPGNMSWTPPVLDGSPRYRVGLETIIGDAGLTHFCVDSHLVTNGQPLGTMHGKRFAAVSEAQLYWDAQRHWRNPLEPVGVASEPGPSRCFALARHPSLSEQVWSATIGYPGAAPYLDFHRKNLDSGLRYHRVTDQAAAIGDKEPYIPEDVHSTLYQHTQHFCGLVRQTLTEHQKLAQKPGVCVAAFDAELFGHWWFEGPQFLRDVIFTLSHDHSVSLATMEEALRDVPPEKVMRLPEGSWGEGGNDSVWLNYQTRWMWEVEYRAENRLLALLKNLPWQQSVPVRQMLQHAARELLLLQASDWPFAVHSKAALDYGIQRFSGHATRFDRAATIAQTLAADGEFGSLAQTQLAEMDAHDDIFAQINLNAFTPD